MEERLPQPPYSNRPCSLVDWDSSEGVVLWRLDPCTGARKMRWVVCDEQGILLAPGMPKKEAQDLFSEIVENGTEVSEECQRKGF